MHVAVTGASGLVGSRLVPLLEGSGHRVLRLVRRPAEGPDEAEWEPATGKVAAGALDGVDALVHLAAEPLYGRWEDPDVKRRIHESRVHATRLLAGHLAGLSAGPRTLVCGGSVGYYGLGRGAEVLTEDSPPGEGFLGSMGREREAAANVAAEAGIRVVNVRVGVGQSPHSGMLKEVLPRFQKGFGGRIGLGGRYLSWIVPDDVAGIVRHVLEVPSLSGGVNAVAPEPVLNREYARVLGRVVGRPALLMAPPFALRRRFGVFAEETLLRSTRALPVKLQATGYRWAHPDLEGALRHVIYGSSGRR